AVMTSGAGVGGTTIQVDRLASSQQRSYTYGSSASDDTITFRDPVSGSAIGSPIAIAAGSDAATAVAAINASADSPVYAAVVGTNQIYLSSKATGTAGAFTVDPSSTTMTGETLVQQGLPALYEVNGGAQQSSDSNTLTSAIPGLPPTLNGLLALGISTGTTTGDSTVSQDSVAGKLTLDAGKLTAALTSDPTSVKNLFSGIAGTGGFANDFQGIIDPVTTVNGVLDT